MRYCHKKEKLGLDHCEELGSPQCFGCLLEEHLSTKVEKVITKFEAKSKQEISK